MGRGADEFFGCEVNSEDPMGGLADELGRDASSGALNSRCFDQIACRDLDSCRRFGTNDHVLDDGNVTEIEYMCRDESSAGTELGTVPCTTTSGGSAPGSVLGFILPEEGMQRLAHLPNSISLSDTLLTPTDLVAFVGLTNGGEDGKGSLDEDERACKHETQSAGGSFSSAACGAGSSGATGLSRLLCEQRPRRGVHRGQGAHKRHRRDRCSRRRRGTTIVLEDGPRAAAAGRRLEAEPRANGDVRTHEQVLETALACLPFGRLRDAALAGLGRGRWPVERRVWYDGPLRSSIAPLSATWESKASIYDVRGAVVSAVMQYRKLMAPCIWLSGDVLKSRSCQALVLFQVYVQESRVEGSSFFTDLQARGKPVGGLEQDVCWWLARDQAVRSLKIGEVDDRFDVSYGSFGTTCEACEETEVKSESPLVSNDVLKAAEIIRAWWVARRKMTQGVRSVAMKNFAWDVKKTRKVGDIEAHVRFLQHVLKAWKRGSRKGLGRVWVRRLHRCQGGKNLADDGEFKRQQQRAEEMLQWYEQYVAIVKRARSGVTPMVLSSFCGGGGSSEGVKRAGGCSVGLDSEDQPDYKRRFGEQTFVQGDATSWALISTLCKKYDFIGCMGSPPCKWYSRARGSQPSKAPALIPLTRDVSNMFFDYWAIENVMGAAKHMSENAAELFGQAFGCKVDRARKIEANFKVWIDESVRQAGLKLRERTCLGSRRRWRRLDEFGRPEEQCCQGNIFAVQGSAPWRCTPAECAEAMGMDRDHMTYERLGQSLPPSYTRLVWAQMCMSYAHDKWGVPYITFDEKEANPHRANRALAVWLRGAGDGRVDSGVSFVDALDGEDHSRARVSVVEPSDSITHESSVPCDEESAFREIFYSHAGGFDQQLVRQDIAWMTKLGPCSEVSEVMVTSGCLIGHNTFLQLSTQAAKRIVQSVARTVSSAGPGTRVTVQLHAKHEAWLRRLGFHKLVVPSFSDGQVVMSIGRRGGGSKESKLDHKRCRAFMDPRDTGEVKSRSDDTKRERAWTPVWWNSELWEGKGMPREVERIMTEGAEVELERALQAGTIPQYPYPDANARYEVSIEADRAVATGHMEYVPSEEVEWAVENGVVHPWTIVEQGPKWRACQDYSGGTNTAVRSAPFTLPTTWDVRKFVKPGKSYFAKYDLRDGFWSVPVAKGCRHRLMMRHPATGRLMRCARLPFGYADSPRVFCMVTEAIAQEFRKRAAGKGVNILCFVDDYLVIGDDERATRFGADLLESLFHEFGFEFAPHKQRGPCQCIEFLGLLISNFEEVCCIGLSEKRQEKVKKLLNAWLEKKPASTKTSKCDPTELARLLGQLVFASQVVQGGRTYMQGMLSQFKGLEVDWRRGLVRRIKDSAWAEIELNDGFWRDLEWWVDSFESRNCVSLIEDRLGVAAITGTDASDWGTGQVAWIDGGRDECVLRFGNAEKRRSINWRELLGVLRIIDMYGDQLRGRVVLLETDNTSAKGAAEQLKSKAEDMQELVRRLLEKSTLHGIHLRFTHTPGAKLDRPDQTSRGDPVDEPRVRVNLEAFDILNRRFGPFTEYMGAERQHRVSSGYGDEAPKIWMHPTYRTVGSGLRLLGERLMASDGERARGVVIVPDAEGAKWRLMLKHFTIVGRRPSGDQHLEMSQLGHWRKVSSQRATLFLQFPRVAGLLRRARVTLNELSLMNGTSEREGYVLSCSEGGAHVPLLKGSIVYSRAPSPGGIGTLYIVWADFDPTSEEGLVDGKHDVLVAELLNVPSKSAKGRKNERSDEFNLSNRVIRDSWGTRPESFSKIGSVPWAVDSSDLWIVDGLVSEKEPSWENKPVKAKEGQAAQWARKAFRFDVSNAEKLTARAMADFEKLAERVVVSAETDASLSSALVTSAVGEDASQGAGDARLALGEATAQLSRLEVSSHDELTAARASADEAALARNHRDPFTRPEVKGQDEKQVSMRRAHICQYPGTICSGCMGVIAKGERITQAGGGIVHLRDECVKLAKVRLIEEAAAAKAFRKTREGAGLQSAKREAQLAHRFSDARLALCAACLDGKCKECKETRVMCSGATDQDGVRQPCGRGIHVSSCASISKHHGQVNMLICLRCRVSEMAPDCLGTEGTLVKAACRSMLVELACGATSTAKNVAEFERLEREWMAEMTTEMDSEALVNLREPRHSTESFIAFCTWLVTDGGRARSFSQLIRVAGIAMCRMEIEDQTKKPRVKMVIKEISEQIGIEPEPCDIPSTAVVLTMLESVLPRLCKSSEYVYGRSLVLFDGETAGGARVGELTGGGDLHGVLAPLCDIATMLEGEEKGLVTINMHIEDSKVGYSRDITYMGETRGPLNLKCEENLRRLWDLSKMKVKKEIRDGMLIEKADYFVMRLSLIDMSADHIARLKKILKNCGDKFLETSKKWIVYYIDQRTKASTLGEEHKYVNIAGGVENGEEITQAKRWLEKWGFAKFGEQTMGPLLRATAVGNVNVITHMPLSPGSTYAHVPKALTEAWEINSREGVIDTELNLLGEKPKFGNHGNRRKADKRACETMDVTKATVGEINDHFGWEQKERKKKSQLHYKGSNHRNKRARVTMML